MLPLSQHAPQAQATQGCKCRTLAFRMSPTRVCRAQGGAASERGGQGGLHASRAGAPSPLQAPPAPHLAPSRGLSLLANIALRSLAGSPPGGGGDLQG